MDDKNLQKTVEDLASDDQFIAWVQSPNHDLDAYWSQWQKDNLSRQKEVSEARDLVNLLQMTEATDDTIAEDRVWDKINAAIDVDQPQVRRMIPWSKAAMAIAAGLALLLGVNFLMTNGQIDINTRSAEIVDHQLPDASTVRVNANSEISYSKRAWKKERKLSLKGEAYFEVEKGSDFVVETALGNVKVLGTSFNVQVRDGSLEVKCLTGKVRVETKDEKIMLLPGQEVVYTKKNNVMEENTFLVEKGIGWLVGRFDFEDALLQEVISELSRQFNVEINMNDDLHARKYSGSFTNKDLNQALYDVCWPMKLQYSVEGRKVHIREE